MFRRDVERFLQRVGAAGIGIGDDEALFVEAGLVADAEHRAVQPHDAARQLQMRKALRVHLRCGDGNTSEKVSQTMPNTAGTCVTFEIHFGRKPSRANSTSVVRP